MSDVTQADASFFDAIRVCRHELTDSPLFTDAALAALIERCPRERRHVNTTYSDGAAPVWREGDIGAVSGHAVIEAVRRGQLWVHLQRVTETDPAYVPVLDGLFDVLQDAFPKMRPYRRTMSVLIASPHMDVAYHCDIPGQSLWQVRGSKKIFVYPNKAPFLPPDVLEKMILKATTDTDLVYEPRFDAEAATYDLMPGQGIHWPRNAPHRITNDGGLNVSVTAQYWTDELRAHYAVNYANGLLRPFVGSRALSQRIDGLDYYAKFALAGVHKKLGLRGAAPLKFNVDFEVDPAAPAGVRDIPAYVFAR